MGGKIGNVSNQVETRKAFVMKDFKSCINGSDFSLNSESSLYCNDAKNIKGFLNPKKEVVVLYSLKDKLVNEKNKDIKRIADSYDPNDERLLKTSIFHKNGKVETITYPKTAGTSNASF